MMPLVCFLEAGQHLCVPLLLSTVARLFGGCSWRWTWAVSVAQGVWASARPPCSLHRRGVKRFAWVQEQELSQHQCQAAPGSRLGAGYPGAAPAGCASSSVTRGTVSGCPLGVVSWLWDIVRGEDSAK